mgnify:CR=1 FL=1
MTGTLSTALRQSTIEPLVRIVLTLGETSLTCSRSRILAVEETMEPYTHTAEVLLDNADGELTDRDLRGYQVVLGWGAVTSTGEEYVDSPPLAVIRQELLSEQGALTCRLLCIGLPDRLGEDRASEAYAPDATDTTVLQSVINAVLAGSLTCYSHCASVQYQWDSADALATGYKPRDGFRVYTNGSRLAALRKLLDFTACAMRVIFVHRLHPPLVAVPRVEGVGVRPGGVGGDVGAGGGGDGQGFRPDLCGRRPRTSRAPSAISPPARLRPKPRRPLSPIHPTSSGAPPPPSRKARGTVKATTRLRDSGGPIPAREAKPAGKKATASTGCRKRSTGTAQRGATPSSTVQIPEAARAVPMVRRTPKRSVAQPPRRAVARVETREAANRRLAPAWLKPCSFTRKRGSMA